MIGLGLDLCEVRRIENAIAHTSGFLERYYTAEERDYLAKRGQNAGQSAAAMFATVARATQPRCRPVTT